MPVISLEYIPVHRFLAEGQMLNMKVGANVYKQSYLMQTQYKNSSTCFESSKTLLQNTKIHPNMKWQFKNLTTFQKVRYGNVS